jgi:hypothetical protein
MIENQAFPWHTGCQHNYLQAHPLQDEGFPAIPGTNPCVFLSSLLPCCPAISQLSLHSLHPVLCWWLPNVCLQPLPLAQTLDLYTHLPWLPHGPLQLSVLSLHLCHPTHQPLKQELPTIFIPPPFSLWSTGYLPMALFSGFFFFLSFRNHPVF